jgi:hypothetical protein
VSLSEAVDAEIGEPKGVDTAEGAEAEPEATVIVGEATGTTKTSPATELEVVVYHS